MADIVLPRRGSGSSGAPRLGRAPTAADVPTAPLTRDPGVRVPNMATGDFSEIGKGLQTFGIGILRAAERQQALYDATKSTEGLLTFESQATEELRRRQTEDDATRPGFLTELDTWLGIERKDGKIDISGGKGGEILSGLPEGVSAEARDKLRLKIIQTAQTISDTAGRFAVGENQKKAMDAADAFSNKLSAQVVNNPDFLPEFMTELDGGLAGFAPGLTPDQERTIKQKGQANLIQSAVIGLAGQGRYNDARSIIGDKTHAEILSEKDRLALTNQVKSAETQDQANEERQQRLAEKKVKDAQEANAVTFWTRFNDPDPKKRPTLPELDRVARARGIDKGDYLALRTAVLSGGGGQDNPAVIVGLADRMAKGENIAPDIRSAAQNGDLKADTIVSLFEKNASKQQSAGIFGTHDYKRATDDLKSVIITTGPMAQFVKQDEQERYGAALSELDRRIRSGSITPDRSQEIGAIVEEMKPRYRSSPMSISGLPRSRYGEIKTVEDVGRFAGQLVADYRAGKIARQDFDVEDALLKQYQDILERNAQIEQAKGGAGTSDRLKQALKGNR